MVKIVAASGMWCRKEGRDTAASINAIVTAAGVKADVFRAAFHQRA